MIRLILIVVLAYGAVVLLAWAFQDRLLYMPSMPGRELQASPADRGWEYEDVRFEAEDGVTLHGWWLPLEEARGTVLFFHGNAGNISHRMDSLAIFRELGLSVFIIDYRGFGESEGSPSEEGTEADARASWDYLVREQGIDPSRIAIFGRSLGAAVAAELGRDRDPGAVILESPFTSLPEMAQDVYPFLPARWLTRYQYNTREHAAAIEAPVLVVHSRDDEIIPFEHGEAVYEAVSSSKALLPLRGGHNTAFLDHRAEYMAGLEQFLVETVGW